MNVNKLKNILRYAFQINFFRGGNLITYIEAKELLRKNPNSILLDVRSTQEYNEYHLAGAICIPTYEIQEKVPNILENKKQIIIVYCQGGARSAKAAKILRKMGYENIYEIDGGIDAI